MEDSVWSPAGPLGHLRTTILKRYRGNITKKNNEKTSSKLKFSGLEDARGQQKVARLVPDHRTATTPFGLHIPPDHGPLGLGVLGTMSIWT